MADEAHLAVLRQGVARWNAWRVELGEIAPELRAADLRNSDLTNANLARANLRGADLRGTDLRGADLRGAVLRGAHLELAALSRADLAGADMTASVLPDVGLARANLSGATLDGANLKNTVLVEANVARASLRGANLRRARLAGACLDGADLRRADCKDAYFRGGSLLGADLSGADLRDADLRESDLSQARLGASNLRGADLRHARLLGADLSVADLSFARLVETEFDDASDLSRCTVYGISAWNVRLSSARQRDLVITRPGEPAITVDNLEVAQFIYLLLVNQKIREVIHTVTSKAVLILGRFTSARKAVLEAVREELRRNNYLPILFDFGRPANRSLTETVSTLAHLARFIVADLTHARSVIQELSAIAPVLRSVPIQPLIHVDDTEWAMFSDHLDLPQMLPLYVYDGQDVLRADMPERIIAPAERRAAEIERRRSALE